MPVPRFDYSIQRPYPYPWFTWVTVVGGAILAVLISLFNLSSDGLRLETIHTKNPNETLAQQAWLSRPPFSWTVRNHVSL